MKVEDVMSDEVIVMQENQQVSYARNLMLKHGLSRVIIVDTQRKPVGIVTEKDLSRKMRGNGPEWKRRPIDKILISRAMTEGLVTIKPSEDIQNAVELMLKNNISSIPVADDDGLAGIITKTDLLNFYKDKYSGKWKVSELMSKNVLSVNENHSIAHVIGVMEENGISKVVVIRDNQPVGIITPENISFASVEDPEIGVAREKIYFIRNSDGKDKKNFRLISMLTASDIMKGDVTMINQDEDAAKAAETMLREEIGGLPVVEDEEIVGIITKTDLIRGIQ
ncbi:MAG TPA: CBS domain-containing protein [Methanobacterium sp.]|nr:MAG: CBS domain-containing protein [Methanobacterium sp.]HPX77179.1 CBS domain-containing protein [Methanobacterium sp.]